MKLKSTTLLLAAAILATCANAMTITAEAPGVQETTLPGMVVETFDNLALGYHSTINSAVGTIVGATVISPDVYGGSHQTLYSSVGAQSGTYDYTLILPGPTDYFGLYWAAGDAHNVLQFLNGSSVVASFTTAEAFSGLSASYYGNPNTHGNPSEPYAFLNFSGAYAGITFNSVRFSIDTLGAGFEVDNLTVKGAHTPEPEAWLLIGGGLLLITAARRRGLTPGWK